MVLTKLRARDSDGDSSPRRYGWSAVRALSTIWEVQDAGCSGGEQDEEADVQEHRDDGANELGDELVAWFRSEEVTGLQVSGHVGTLSGGSGGDDTRDQVHHHGGVLLEARTLADTSENELGGLRDGGDGVDISGSCGLDTDEGEEEAEEKGEDGFADVHVEHGREDGAAHDDAQRKADHPPRTGNAVLNWCLVLVVFFVREDATPVEIDAAHLCTNRSVRALQ